jgi:hypothetical protein
MMAAQVSNLKNELIDHETFASRAQTAREKRKRCLKVRAP